MKPPDEWTPLLTKPFNTYSPEDFKLYVRSLFNKPAKKVRTIKLKKQKPPFSWKLSPKKRTLSLTVNREPKWLSEGEMALISAQSGAPLSAIFITMKKKGIKVSTETEEKK